jgi:hypothetical protein
VKRFLLLLALLAAPALAQEDEAPAPQPAASLDDFAWMAGRWIGEGFGATVEEYYSPAVGGQMPGHFRMIGNGATTLYEFVMLAEVDGSLEYRVRHFNPDMTAWEERDEFVRFALVSVEGNAWHFEGLTIRRTGPDTAEHVLRVRSGESGEENVQVLRYRRATH